jgi:dTDP-4-dehydrorhamnose reductase
MKILVTGSNGLVGQKLTARLQTEQSVELIATSKSDSVVTIERGKFFRLDITKSDAVNDIVTRTRPDVIINTAAITQVDQCELDHDSCWENNVTSVANLIAVCAKNKVHLLHVSTDFVFDGKHELLDETATPGPVNFYGESKLAAERLIIESGISWCIARTVLVFGVTRDMSRSNIVLWVKRSLEQGKTIQVVNDQWRTPTLAEDLAAGCLLAALQKAQGIYHISGNDYMSVYEIALRTADFFHLDKSLIKPTDSTTFTQPAKRPMKTGFIIDKARKTLGYEPHSFEEGLTIVASQL